MLPVGINKDIAVKIALMLDLPEVLSLCRTNKKFNEYVCNNKIFWNNRLVQDFGKYGHNVKNMEISSKNYYQIVKKFGNIGIYNIYYNSVKYGAVKTMRIILRDNRFDPKHLENGIKIAIKKGYVDMVRLLLDDHRINTTDISMVDLLVLASKYSNVEIVSILLDDIVDCDDIYKCNEDIIKYINKAFTNSIKHGNNDITKLLMDYPLSCNTISIGFVSSVENNNNDISELLLNNILLSPNGIISGFIKSVKNDNNYMTLLMMDKFSQINRDTYMLSQGLNYAVINNNKYMFDLFFNNPLTKTSKAMVSAVIKGNDNIIRVLLSDFRTDISYNNNQILNLVTSYNNINMIRLLLKYPNKIKTKPPMVTLEWASKNGHLDIVKLLVDTYHLIPSYTSVAVTYQVQPNTFGYLINHPKTPLSTKRIFNPPKKKTKNKKTQLIKLDQIGQFI